MMTSPSFMAILPSHGARSHERKIPIPIVTSGVTRMSTLVSLEIALPNSDAMMAINRTARGPPAPPRAFAAKPTVIIENITSGGHLRA